MNCVYLVVHKALAQPGGYDILDSVWFDLRAAKRRHEAILWNLDYPRGFGGNVYRQAWRVYKFTESSYKWVDVTEDKA